MILLNRLGLSSLLLGALAVPTAFAAVYARTSHIPGSGVILQWMERLGLVNQPTNGIDTLSESSMFAINDQNGITLLFAVAIVCAVVSICCALLAEYRHEPTLYLSSGYVCSTLAISLMKPSVGFTVFMVGIAAVLVHRYGRDT